MESRWYDSIKPPAVQNLEMTSLSHQKWAQRGPSHQRCSHSFCCRGDKITKNLRIDTQKKMHTRSRPPRPFVSKHSGLSRRQAERSDALAPLPVLKSRLLNLPRRLSTPSLPSTTKNKRRKGKADKNKLAQTKGTEDKCSKNKHFQAGREN